MSRLMQKNIYKLFFSILILLGQAVVAHGGALNLVQGIAQGEFHGLTKELGLAVHYVPASPAEPLGITGFDVGLEVTGASIDADNPYWQKAAPNTPGFLPIPKLHVQKGLPFGIDLGAIYTSVPELDFSIVGGEIKYALLSGNIALPAVAIRGAITQLTGVSTLDLHTRSLDLSVSKGVTFITPYAGVGLVQIHAKEKAGLGLSEEDQNLSKVFAGLKISLALINFIAEADFAEIPLYTLRVNVGF